MKTPNILDTVTHNYVVANFRRFAHFVQQIESQLDELYSKLAPNKDGYGFRLYANQQLPRYVTHGVYTASTEYVMMNIICWRSLINWLAFIRNWPFAFTRFYGETDLKCRIVVRPLLWFTYDGSNANIMRPMRMLEYLLNNAEAIGALDYTVCSVGAEWRGPSLAVPVQEYRIHLINDNGKLIRNRDVHTRIQETQY